MKTRSVNVGNVVVGGDSPVSIQTMWKEPLPRVDDELVARVEGLKAIGCEILRFACPDLAAAEALGELSRRVSIPLVADIHFDWRLALRCLDFPIAKIRINPGNIGERWKVAEVTAKASDKGVPIRIGVNGGSLPRDLAENVDRAMAIVEAAEREVEAFDTLGFRDIVVSMKASDVAETIRVNEIFSSRHDIPLHVGVTEAGPLIAGIAKNAAALHSLLSRGIGSTVRVSLSDTMESEIFAARTILEGAGMKRGGVTLVSCPRCARATFDTHAFAKRWEARLYALPKDVTVAIMGCVVNGPGEGKHADLGITGAGDKVIVFRHGEIARTCGAESADTVFMEELSKL